MSMYNQMHGMNPITLELLAILDLTVKGLVRFRDIHLMDDHIRVLTRNGGGNKVYGIAGNGRKTNCIDTRRCMECIGCVMFDILPKHPEFIREYDSMFDPTFAYIEFKIPKKTKEVTLNVLRKRQPHTMNLKESMEDLKNNSDKYMKQMDKFASILNQAIKDQGDNKGINIIKI